MSKVPAKISLFLAVGWLGGAALLNSACSSDDPAKPGISGPPNGVVEVDPDTIPLGESGGSSNQGQAGSSARGGAVNTPSVKSPIGKACETSADCDNGLSCHMDSSDLIAHKQCSTYCADEAPCLAIDKDSFCIGANVCVHACTSNADCGPKTLCNKSGWCERTGPGSGVPYCGGSPTPCFVLSGISCTSSFGCNDDSQCAGSADSCYSQFDSFSCTSQDGCFWSSSSKNCSGSAHSCSSYSFDFECTSQDGCSWSSKCTGEPRLCSDMPTAVCDAQPGCVVLND